MEERDPHLSDPLQSQAYRKAEHPEPSPALDARILEAARQAVAQPPARKRSRWFTWALPLSTAAVLVLGLSVLFEVQRQAPEYMAPPNTITSAEQPEMADADSAPMPAEPTVKLPYQAPAEPAQQTEAADSVEPVGRSAASAPERGGGAQWTSAESTPAPQPFPTQPGTAPAMPLPPPVPPLPQVAAKAETRPTLQAPSPSPSQAQPMATRDAVEAGSNLAGQSGATLSAPPPASAVAPSREKAPAFSQALGKRKAAVPGAEGPEQMVETIRRLLREGRQEEARKELEKLRRVYPGFALPEDLKGL